LFALRPSNQHFVALEDARRRIAQHQHLLKYLAIGTLAASIDAGLFLVLYNWGATSALVAHSMSVPTAVLFSFTVNARHNFHTNDYVMLRFLSFVVVCVIGYLTGLGMIRLNESLGLGANIGKMASLPAVFLIQYTLNSRITFRKAEVVRSE
jgi:putative flippase GtrA